MKSKAINIMTAIAKQPLTSRFFIILYHSHDCVLFARTLESVAWMCTCMYMLAQFACYIKIFVRVSTVMLSQADHCM